jgi:hypothetical protein
MATRNAIATMDAEARGRLDRALTRITDRLRIDELPPAPPLVRDPAYAAAQALAWQADVLEAIDAALAERTGDAAPPDALDLRGLKRSELEAHAADLGVENPADFPNKDALIEAIEERLTAPDDEPADDSFGEPVGEFVDADSIPPQPAQPPADEGA